MGKNRDKQDRNNNNNYFGARPKIAPSNDAYRELQFSLEPNRLYIALYREQPRKAQRFRLSLRQDFGKYIFLNNWL